MNNPQGQTWQTVWHTLAKIRLDWALSGIETPFNLRIAGMYFDMVNMRHTARACRIAADQDTPKEKRENSVQDR